MSDHLDNAEIEKRLWSEVDKARFGMLGLVGGQPHHMQPMACFADKDAGAVWFFTKKTSDLVRDTGQGHAAMLCLMQDHFQACIGGQLKPDHDRAKIDKFWNPHVSAWFPDGKDDPDLTLLQLDVDDAKVWVSQKGLIGYSLELAKAKAAHRTPDVGDVAHLKLG